MPTTSWCWTVVLWLNRVPTISFCNGLARTRCFLTTFYVSVGALKDSFLWILSLASVTVQSTTLLKNKYEFLLLRPKAKIEILGELAARPTLGYQGSSDRRPDHAVHPFKGMQAASTADGLVTQFNAITTKSSKQAVREAEAVILVVSNTYREEGEYTVPLSNLVALAENFPPPPQLHWILGGARGRGNRS